MNKYENITRAVADCRKLASVLLSRKPSASEPVVYAVGHAHIDVAWLWPMRIALEKAASTFSSQIANIEKYKDYVFGASQPVLYAHVKEKYPRLFEKIQQAVKKGSWECQGGMWVEPDCNVTGGESFVRQILHGKLFFRENLGVDVKNIWIPDVFGYTSVLPQIMKKCGIDYFLTQKISWNLVNNFPYHSFFWVGMDGTGILTHFPPENTYNSNMDAEKIKKASENYLERSHSDAFMSLFGIGDGGGGPKEEHLERALRQSALEQHPKVRFADSISFFNRLKKSSSELPVWKGELYLECHRATLTTQARNKRWNRKLEKKLRETEILYSMLPLKEYPADTLDRLWKILLTNQFHDILPGSSINEVYQDTEKQYSFVNCELDKLQSSFSIKKIKKSQDTVTVLNTLSVPCSRSVRIAGWKGHDAVVADGTLLPSRDDGKDLLVLADIPPLSSVEIKKKPCALYVFGQASVYKKGRNIVMENSLVRYVFGPDGILVSGFDKE